MNRVYIDIHTHLPGREKIGTVTPSAVPAATVPKKRKGRRTIEVPSFMAGVGARWPGPYSVGIHPWQVGTLGARQTAEALDEVATSPAWAVGEIGLDFVWARDHGGRFGRQESDNPGERAAQETVFEAQLAIAEKRGLPIIVHCVRTFERTMEILERHSKLRAVILHGFVGSPRQAMRAVMAGYYLSFGERSLRSPRTVEAIRLVSLDNIFAETDESPVPITDVYARLAQIKGVTVDELARIIEENYGRVV